jgi:hypothetical protein
VKINDFRALKRYSNVVKLLYTSLSKNINLKLLAPKSGKSVNYAVNLLIYQNYEETGLYGQDPRLDKAKDGKCA